MYSIWLFLCTIQIHCLIFLHRYICTCITLISSLSAYPSPPDTSHAYLKIAVAQICLHHKIRYCTIKSFFSILKLTIIFLCLLGAFTSSYNASKSYFVLCYNKTTKKWLSLFSLPCSQLILSIHMHRFLESSACRSSELHQPAVQPEYFGRFPMKAEHLH